MEGPPQIPPKPDDIDDLEDQREWLIQDYDTAIEANDLEETQAILKKIHALDDQLGHEHYEWEPKPEPLPPNPPILPDKELIESKWERVYTLAKQLFISPDDPQIRRQFRELVNGPYVKALTNFHPAKGYIDMQAKRAYTFIKLDDNLSLYGEGDFDSFAFDKFLIISNSEARERFGIMENNPALKKQHA